MDRIQIYDLIDNERTYQDVKWGPTETKGKHSITEFIAYCEDYFNEAKHIMARESMTTAYPKVRKILPKVAAMLVACMEQNGAIGRY